MTRTVAALLAMRTELERRRAQVDGDDGASDLISITIEVKFQRGTSQLRGTVYTDERLSRSTTPADRNRPLERASLGVRERADVKRRGD